MHLSLLLATLASTVLANNTHKPCDEPASSSCARTECADYINDCGLMYGGCYPACIGYPTPSFSDPGCPPSYSASATITSYTKSSASSSAGCVTICVDKVNDCGKWYGGCFCPENGTPSFSVPPCPSSTGAPQYPVSSSSAMIFTTV